MKILIDGFNIDLREVTAIGPLHFPHNAMVIGGGGCAQRRGFGCSVWLFGRNDPFWLNMGEGEIDPYQIDDAKNAYTRTTANIAYNNLVSQWQAVP